MDNLVRIKTTEGYYFSQAGRYMRFYGDKLTGWLLCPTHADEMMECLQRVVPELQPETEAFKGHAACQECKRKR